MILDVIQQPNPILREIAVTVDTVTEDIKSLISDMLATMYQYNGVGLAAPQVGYPVAVIVFDPSPERNMPSALINPQIISHSKQQEEAIEGCLSCRGFDGKVLRYTKITVKGLGPDGQPVKFKAEGFLARILQHEIDHLNGEIIMDKATPLTDQELAELAEDEAFEESQAV